MFDGFSTELTHRFAATPAQVFRAFTDPAVLPEWFGPHAFRVPPESVDLDIRPGGRWHLTMVNHDNPSIQIQVRATVVEVIAAERFVLSRQAQGYHDMPDGTRLELHVDLVADGDGTIVHLTDGPYSEFMRDANTSGWLQEFAKLDEVLASTPATPALRLVE